MEGWKMCFATKWKYCTSKETIHSICVKFWVSVGLPLRRSLKKKKLRWEQKNEIHRASLFRMKIKCSNPRKISITKTLDTGSLLQRAANLEFAVFLPGQMSHAGGLQIDQPTGDLLVPLLLQVTQHASLHEHLGHNKVKPWRIASPQDSAAVLLLDPRSPNTFSPCWRPQRRSFCPDRVPSAAPPPPKTQREQTAISVKGPVDRNVLRDSELPRWAAWPFSRRGWQTWRHSASWWAETTPGSDTWSRSESCARDNLRERHRQLNVAKRAQVQIWRCVKRKRTETFCSVGWKPYWSAAAWSWKQKFTFRQRRWGSNTAGNWSSLTRKMSFATSICLAW